MLEVRKSNDFEPISDALKQEMRSLLGESWFTTDEATLSEYGHDETEDFPYHVEWFKTEEEARKALLTI